MQSQLPSPFGQHRTRDAVMHDLRAPLSAMQAVTHAIEDGVLSPDEQVAYLRQLESLAERLLHLTRELYAASTVDRRATISLTELVQDTVVLAEVLAAAKGVVLTVDPLDDSLVVVSPPRVIRAMDNILENAVRHTATGGTIRIMARLGMIEIADGCGGIPGDQLSRLFAPGFQGDPATAGEAGIGLFLARMLIEEQGGSVSVANNGPGCRFGIRLRMAQT